MNPILSPFLSPSSCALTVICFFRIGRGGRFGRKGAAINFVTEQDKRQLADIEQHYHTTITEMPLDVADLL